MYMTNKINKIFLYTILSNIALAVIIITIFNLNDKWMIWCSLGIVVLMVTPIVSKIFGNLENLLFCFLVFALQLQVGFNPIYRSMNKMAGLNGLNISLCFIIAFILLCTWFVKRCAQEARPLTTNKMWNLAGVAFLLLSAISIVKTSDKHLTLFGLYEILSLLLIATMTCHYCSTRKGLRTVRTVFLVSLLLQSLLIIVQNITGWEYSLVGKSIERHSTRFSGTMLVPSAAATYIMVLLFFALGTAFSAVSKRIKALVWIIIFVGILALLLTLTRAAWSGFFIGALIILAYFCITKAIKLSSVFYTVTLLLIGVVLTWSVLGHRLQEKHSEDAIVRWNLVLIALDMIEKNPVLGVGLNNATQVVHKYAAETRLIANAEGFVWVFIVHNQFLLVASETGIPGLIAFLAVIGIALRAAVTCMRARDPVVSETGAILMTSIIALVWALNMDHVAGAQTYILLWFIMSFAIGLRNILQADMALTGAAPHRQYSSYPYDEAHYGATAIGRTRLVDAYSDSAGRFGVPQ